MSTNETKLREVAPELLDEWAGWLRTLPQSARDLAAKYPQLRPDFIVDMDGERRYFVAFNTAEDGAGITLSRINPNVDYERACSEHMMIEPNDVDAFMAKLTR